MTKRIILLVSILLMLATTCVLAEGINRDYELLHNLNIVSEDYETYMGKKVVTHNEFIRDVYAFPMNKNGCDPLTNAPNIVDEKALKDIHIRIREEDLI